MLHFFLSSLFSAEKSEKKWEAELTDIKCWTSLRSLVVRTLRTFQTLPKEKEKKESTVSYVLHLLSGHVPMLSSLLSVLNEQLSFFLCSTNVITKWEQQNTKFEERPVLLSLSFFLCPSQWHVSRGCAYVFRNGRMIRVVSSCVKISQSKIPLISSLLFYFMPRAGWRKNLNPKVFSFLFFRRRCHKKLLLTYVFLKDNICQRG